MGRTKHIAVGATTTYTDNVDLWQEEVNDEFTKYKVDGEWKDIIKRVERIKVKG